MKSKNQKRKEWMKRNSGPINKMMMMKNNMREMYLKREQWSSN